MIGTRTDRTVVAHIFTTETYTSVGFFTRSRGPGRAGRMVLATVHVACGPGEPLSDVLRAAAHQLELPPLSRWQPPS